MERQTQTRPRATTKEHYVLQTSRYLSSPQAKLFRFPSAGRAASIPGAAGLEGIDRRTTFWHIGNLVQSDAAPLDSW